MLRIPQQQCPAAVAASLTSLRLRRAQQQQTLLIGVPAASPQLCAHRRHLSTTIVFHGTAVRSFSSAAATAAAAVSTPSSAATTIVGTAEEDGLEGACANNSNTTATASAAMGGSSEWAGADMLFVDDEATLGTMASAAGASSVTGGATPTASNEYDNSVDFMASMLVEGFSNTSSSEGGATNSAQRGSMKKGKKGAKRSGNAAPSATTDRQRPSAAAATEEASADPADAAAGDSFYEKQNKKRSERSRTVKKLRRQLQFLAAKEIEMEKAQRLEVRVERRRRMAAAAEAADGEGLGNNNSSSKNATDGSNNPNPDNAANGTKEKKRAERQEEYLRSEFERLRRQRADYSKVPDDLSETLPSNDALDTAMAFSILSHKDARANLDFTHKLLKSNLLSLAAPVGWWDPYDVKPQAFAMDQYAALPVFTNVSYLQHFCHQYGFAVRDPSGLLWADGANAAVDPPKLAPPSPWRRGGEDRGEQQTDGDEGTGVDAEGSPSAGTAAAASSVEPPQSYSGFDDLASAGSILGRDKVKAAREEREAQARRAAAEKQKQQLKESEMVGGSATTADGLLGVSTAPPPAPIVMQNLVVDRVTARQFEATIVEGNASIDSEAFMDMLSGEGDEAPPSSTAPSSAAAPTATTEGSVGAADTAGHSAHHTTSQQQQQEGSEDGADLFMDMFTAAAEEEGAAAAAADDGKVGQTKGKASKRREAKRAKAAARRAAKEANAEADRQFRQRMAARAKEEAEAKEKLWAALEATPKSLRRSTSVTPLITYGPFIRPYFVGYYADFRTLLHNASIVPRMVDIIVNPGSPMETIISRSAATEAVTNQSLLRAAYARVEHQLRAEFHNFFLLYCNKQRKGSSSSSSSTAGTALVQSAASYCMAQPAPESTKEEDTLYDIVIIVDCEDFERLTRQLRKAKQRGILKGHSSLHVVPAHDCPEFMLEGATTFFTCEPEQRRAEYTPVDFYAPEQPSNNSNDAAGQQQQQQPKESTMEAEKPSHSEQSAASAINTNIGLRRLSPETRAALEAFRQQQQQQTSGGSTAAGKQRDAHAHAPRKVGKFAQIGSHATISTRADADSIYADPTNQSTESSGLAAQRIRLGTGIEGM